MESNELLLRKLNLFIKKNKRFENGFFGSDLFSRIFRVVIGTVKYGGKYLRYIAVRTGIIKNKDVQSELFWGRRVILPINDNDAAIIYYSGGLTGLEYRLTKYILKNFSRSDVFYDVGANYGFYTYLAQELITSGQIHAFEPQKEICRYIEKNTSSCSNCFTNNAALADFSGKTSLFVSDKYSGGNTIVQDIAESQFAKMNKMEVEVLTMDDYVKNHAFPSFIKVDVEGAEYNVLKGAEITI